MKLKIGKKSGLRYFSYSDIQSWKPCYDSAKYIPKDWRGTAIDILKLDKVPAADRLWVCLRPQTANERTMRLFAVWCARQVQHLMKDPRSIAALDVAERFANGEATEEERGAAWDAALAAAHAAGGDTAWHTAGAAASAAAVDAARTAALAAARDTAGTATSAAVRAAAHMAGGDIAADAALAAVMDAAEAAQVAKLIEMIEAEGRERVSAKTCGEKKETT